jgi:DNA-directed RNA polymerase subunit beta'
MSIQHASSTFDSVKRNLVEHLTSLFPLESEGRTLRLTGPIVVDDRLAMDDYEGQRAARTAGKSWTVPVKAPLELLKGDRVIDRKTVKLLDLPRLTNRGSYIVGGTEYMFPAQKRVRSGVYVRTRGDGTTEAMFNLKKGRNFSVAMHPSKGNFVIEIATTTTLPLYPLLRALGVEDSEMVKAWGREVFTANHMVESSDAYKKAQQRIFDLISYNDRREDAQVPQPADMNAAIRDKIGESSWDGDNVELTLGFKTAGLDGPSLLAAATKLLQVNRNEAKEDNRESLIHSDIVDLSDYIVERYNDRQFRGRLQRQLARMVGNADTVTDAIPRDAFQRPVNSLMTEAAISRSPNQGNPLGIMSDYTAVTVRGEGGIESDHALTRGVRALDPSHLGFLDPAHTPEGAQIGTTLHLAAGTRKKGRTLVTDVWNFRSKSLMEATPIDIHKGVIAFPDFFDVVSKRLKPVNGKIKAMKAGEIVEVLPAEVDMAFTLPEQLFDTNSLAVPFLSHNNGVRLMTAAKMGVQSKTLVHREAPKVQVLLPDQKETLEGAMGKSFSVQSPVDGVVEKIEEQAIIVSGQKVPMPKYFPLNNGNYWHAKPKVKVGDKVKKGQLLADTNFTKDGVLAQGTNLRVAYVPYKGLNFEDGVVISEGASSKLTSEHVYPVDFAYDSETVINKKSFQSYFPTTFTEEQVKQIDDGGLITVGTTLTYGMPMVLALKKRQLGTEGERLASISRMLATEYSDASLTWKKHVAGEVLEIVHRNNEIVIHVRTEEPARIGDKIVGRYGNKGVIVHIIPNDQMPKDAGGKPLDLLLNPNGVVGRMNLGQILETTSSRISEKTGKPYVASGFGGNATERVTAELKKLGLKDHETIHDPIDNIDIPGILVGSQYIYKLEHQATKKVSSRGGGPEALEHGEVYTSENQPAKGSGVGGRAIGSMEMYALLAHGATKNIHEIYTSKSNFDPEFWRAVVSGLPLPPPKATFSSEKFVTLLKGAGIDVRIDEDMKEARFVPFLDRQVLAASNGEIKKSAVIRDKDGAEIPGGLFDLKATGGLKGEHYSHITLPEPMPSPMFSKAIATLLGIREDDISSVIDGSMELKSGGSGPQALKKALSAIDVDARIKAVETEIVGKKAAQLNKLHRELRFLKALKSTGTKPSEYMISVLPVIPPKFRPIYTLPDGAIRVSDLNYHYQALLQLNEQIARMKGKPEFKDEYKKALGQVYKGINGVAGVDAGIVDRKGQDIKGIVDTLSGQGSPKGGYVHSTMLKRRQDMSGSAVATVNPKLGLDEVGIPEETAWKMFRPLVQREMSIMGFKPNDAKKDIDDRTPGARQALENVMRSRVVTINRAPSLHKFSIMAFKPRLTKGYAVEMNPFVFNGLNLDLDGDVLGMHVPVSEEANAEAHDMLPSKHLYKPGSGALMPKLGQEYVLGLYRITSPGEKTTKVYSSTTAAIADLTARKIAPNAMVSVRGLGATTPGRVLINSVLPAAVRDYGLIYTQKATNAKLEEIDKKVGRDAFSKALSAISDIGRQYAYSTGASFLLSDLQVMTKDRNDAYRIADRKADAIRLGPGTEAEKRKKLIEIYQAVSNDLTNNIHLKDNDSKGRNNITEMLTSGARGSPEQARQLVANVGVMLDHENRPMPLPVRGTYTEGLDTAEYFQHMYGARKGMIDKSQSVRDPGALTKQMVVSATSFRVAMLDCGTKGGIAETTKRNDAIDRYLAEDIPGVARHNEVVTTTVLNKARAKGIVDIKVRSPLTCLVPQGVCVRCYGLDAEGQPPSIGAHVGVVDTHAITEPTTQMALKSFHTGGVATQKQQLSTGFDRAAQLFEMPSSLRGHAIVAEVPGVVSSVEKSNFGGWYVTIANNKHRIPHDREVIVKVGDVVTPGQALTSGSVRPQDTMRLRGLHAARMTLRDDIRSVFAEGGVNLKPKTIETAVRMLTDTVRIINAGDHPHLVVGDHASMSQVENWNRENRDKHQVRYVNELPGSEFLPHKQDDWAHRMAHNRLSEVLTTQAPMAGTASLKGPSPFASLFLGRPIPLPVSSTPSIGNKG